MNQPPFCLSTTSISDSLSNCSNHSFAQRASFPNSSPTCTGQQKYTPAAGLQCSTTANNKVCGPAQSFVSHHPIETCNVRILPTTHLSDILLVGLPKKCRVSSAGYCMGKGRPVGRRIAKKFDRLYFIVRPLAPRRRPAATGAFLFRFSSSLARLCFAASIARCPAFGGRRRRYRFTPGLGS